MTKKVTKTKKEVAILAKSPWTKNEKKVLAQCLRSGKSAVETASELGRTVAAVWCMKHKMVQSGEIKTAKAFRSHRIDAPVAKPKTAKKVSKTSAKPVSTAKKRK